MFQRGDPGGPFGPDQLQQGPNALWPALLITRLVLPVLFILFLVLLAVLLYRLLNRSPGTWGGHHSAALRELEMRYARGEIGREEFLQRRQDLASPAIPPAVYPHPAPPATTLPPPTQPPQPPAQTPGQAPAG